MGQHKLYLIGMASTVKPNGESTVILLDYEVGPPEINISTGLSPHYPGAAMTAAEWLAFRNHDLRWENGKCIEPDVPTCYMEIKCAEADCEWFIPFWRKMAHDQTVKIAEIQEAYRINNEGREMPYGHLDTIIDEVARMWYLKNV